MGKLLLMPEKSSTSFRLSATAQRRLRKLCYRLGKAERDRAEVLETAITHCLGSLERDQPLWMTVPSEPQTAIEEETA